MPNDAKATNDPVDVSSSLEKIQLVLQDGEIAVVRQIASESEKFNDSFNDGPTFRDSFGDGGQWESSFNKGRGSSQSVRHPAIQEALRKIAAAIEQTAREQ
ncbi:hypothetical protein [Crateriforma spongiae]|uniref:hypothetical protein n=1 Tax=Crateriforma spongiae TaxID=2724528 RepID=UPI0039AF76AE